jgi:hypothetical protein
MNIIELLVQNFCLYSPPSSTFFFLFDYLFEGCFEKRDEFDEVSLSVVRIDVLVKNIIILVVDLVLVALIFCWMIVG